MKKIIHFLDREPEVTEKLVQVTIYTLFCTALLCLWLALRK